MSRRFAIQCPFYYLDGHSLGSGTVRDISKKGWRAEGNCSIETGIDLSLSILLPGLTVPLKVEHAIVQWTRNQEFGLQVVEMQLVEWDRFERFVSRLIPRLYPSD